MEDLRLCRRCGKERLLEDFRISRGYMEWVCLPCSRKRTREYLSKWRSIPGNREAAVTSTREWRRLFPDKSRKSSTRYQRLHPEVSVNTQHRRRANMLVSNIPSKYIAELRKIGYCMYCGVICGSVHIEHMTPISRGGMHEIDNLTVACPDCNRQKHTMTFPEYVEFRAHL